MILKKKIKIDKFRFKKIISYNNIMDFENIYKSRKNILKMLRLRGFDTSKYDNQNREELIVLYQNKDKKTSSLKDTIDILIEREDKKVFVKYILSEKPRSSAIKKYIDGIYFEDNSFLEKEDEIIFITKDKVTYKGALENYMNSIYLSNKIFCQVIWLNSLLYDITENKLTPNYRILSQEEKLKIMDKYTVGDEKNFPNVLINDPLAVYYGVKLNELVEVTYPSKTNGITYFYRLCVTSI